MSETRTFVAYEMVDPSAAEDGALSVSEKQPWVSLAQIHEDSERTLAKYGTLEHDEFRLDGSMVLFPDKPEHEFMGLWSESMSDENGVFAAPPVLTVAFGAPHTSLGVTLEFSQATEDYASDVNIRWYDADGAVLADADFSPDRALYLCERQVEDYRKIEITFRRTNKPLRYLKLAKVQYGVVQQLDESDLTEASLVEEVDPTSATVSVNTFRFGFRADRRFDLLALSGAYVLFQQQQRVRVRQSVGGAVREMGTFYTETPEVEEGRAVTLDCIDLVGVIDKAEYMGGLWLDGIRADKLLAEIKAAAGTDECELEEELRGTMVRGYLPVCTPREALQQLAFVLGAQVSCARSEKIRIYRACGAAQPIVPHDKAVGHRQKQREYVSGVEVYVHNYTAGNSSEVFKGELEAGEQTVKFSAPTTGLSCSGAEIIESGVNFARVNVAEKREVTITGTPYQDQTSLGGSVYSAAMPANARANVKTIENCTLTADPQAVAQRMYDYYQRRVEDSGDLFPVAPAAGDVVELQSAGGRALNGQIESMEIDLTGGGIAKAVVVGG